LSLHSSFGLTSFLVDGTSRASATGVAMSMPFSCRLPVLDPQSNWARCVGTVSLQKSDFFSIIELIEVSFAVSHLSGMLNGGSKTEALRFGHQEDGFDGVRRLRAIV
jgi:hypothetical protein